ncbi:hypothetical protein CRG98_003949 [Punica granatum]|uniref:Uncharacterized protein n=1 Tax=Punica granatum TaxID=22663 RepID=A0A2I0L4P7_PUNGR|nr:hypothetical protein CRG98_003949 [Punica granatum]
MAEIESKDLDSAQTGLIGPQDWRPARLIELIGSTNRAKRPSYGPVGQPDPGPSINTQKFRENGSMLGYRGRGVACASFPCPAGILAWVELSISLKVSPCREKASRLRSSNPSNITSRVELGPLARPCSTVILGHFGGGAVRTTTSCATTMGTLSVEPEMSAPPADLQHPMSS